MWFKFGSKVSVNKEGNIKNSTIINGSDKLNEIYLMVGEIRGTLTSINNELRHINTVLDRVNEDNAMLKNRLQNLENNYYRGNRRY